MCCNEPNLPYSPLQKPRHDKFKNFSNEKKKKIGYCQNNNLATETTEKNILHTKLQAPNRDKAYIEIDRIYWYVCNHHSCYSFCILIKEENEVPCYCCRQIQIPYSYKILLYYHKCKSIHIQTYLIASYIMMFMALKVLFVFMFLIIPWYRFNGSLHSKVICSTFFLILIYTCIMFRKCCFTSGCKSRFKKGKTISKGAYTEMNILLH